MSSTTLTSAPTRELVLLGESDPTRRGGRHTIAMSECEFRLPDDAALARCIAALRASDEMLAARPDSPYDWKATWVERSPAGGGTVAFGVVWYDEAFFTRRRTSSSGPRTANCSPGSASLRARARSATGSPLDRGVNKPDL